MTGRARNLFLVIIAVWIAFALGISVGYVFDDPEPSAPEPQTVAMVDGADNDTKADDSLRLGPAAQKVLEQADDGDFSDIEGDLRGDDPTKAGVRTGPLAAQEWPGCTTAFVRNFSSRQGTIPSVFAVHYTAGWNIVGLADMNGLTAYADNPRNEVSWNFLIDREGHCYYNVPVRYKAWTIGNLNRPSINVEMIGRGTEANYGNTAGMTKLAQVFARVRTIYPGIQLRLGATDGNCNITRSGIITHWMGGSCSGGHHDIRPYSITEVIGKMQRILNARPAGSLSGPRPKPAWFWQWCDWHLGGRDGTRPDNGPTAIPPWGWQACKQWALAH